MKTQKKPRIGPLKDQGGIRRELGRVYRDARSATLSPPTPPVWRSFSSEFATALKTVPPRAGSSPLRRPRPADIRPFGLGWYETPGPGGPPEPPGEPRAPG